MILNIIKWLVIIVLVIGAIGLAFVNFHPVFGGKPDAKSQAKINASKAYNGEKFVNLEPTHTINPDEVFNALTWVKEKMSQPDGLYPSQPLPTVALDKSALKNGSVVWFGHSTVLFQTANKRFITDPVFHYASPVPLAGKPFAMTHTPTVAELPELDAVLISHDHYDHLDYYAIKEIDAKTKHFYVPLGVKAHLQRWGVADEKITELDWHEQAKLDDVVITLVPARHFSGRLLKRDLTLWGGYVVKSPDLSLYFSADSGYGKHFASEIAQYAPFDFVMIENGAYDKRWALIHETPEQAVQAVQDVKGQKVLPIHWGKFSLAPHHWKDPIKRFMQSAKEHNLQVATPKIGQVFQIGDLPNGEWWDEVE